MRHTRTHTHTHTHTHPHPHPHTHPHTHTHTRARARAHTHSEIDQDRALSNMPQTAIWQGGSKRPPCPALLPLCLCQPGTATMRTRGCKLEMPVAPSVPKGERKRIIWLLRGTLLLLASLCTCAPLLVRRHGTGRNNSTRQFNFLLLIVFALPNAVAHCTPA